MGQDFDWMRTQFMGRESRREGSRRPMGAPNRTTFALASSRMMPTAFAETREMREP